MTFNGCGHVTVNKKILRCGYTTGSCAAAASKAAAMMLLSGIPMKEIEITTPNGTPLRLAVEDIAIDKGSVRCAVRKDGGDDVDATHGLLVYSEVRFRDDGTYNIDGGIGIGRVTKNGLDQPVGNAAINHIPREMITECVRDACSSEGYTGGMDVLISVPEGEKVSEKTFNPRLGIMGGISILGTSGIVEPMSEYAIVETIRKEMDVHVASGDRVLLVVPGNYGKDFSENIDGLDPESAIKCSNFVGEMLDHASELHVEGLLLVGNLGKLVKIAGGIMNTHSKNGDSRMEIITANLISAGGDAETGRRIMNCTTTDDALDVLSEVRMIEPVMQLIVKKMTAYMNHRVNDEMVIGVVVFSSKYGLLGMSDRSPELIRMLKEQGS
ncbi:MAG: cobalt-precorrin-5B (C(1))-methyltransferase CbiD [Candidatus Methanomethylophilaceae archaeon]